MHAYGMGVRRAASRRWRRGCCSKRVRRRWAGALCACMLGGAHATATWPHRACMLACWQAVWAHAPCPAHHSRERRLSKLSHVPLMLLPASKPAPLHPPTGLPVILCPREGHDLRVALRREGVGGAGGRGHGQPADQRMHRLHLGARMRLCGHPPGSGVPRRAGHRRMGGLRSGCVQSQGRGAGPGAAVEAHLSACHTV